MKKRLENIVRKSKRDEDGKNKKSEPISALFPLLTLQNRETELSLLATKTDRVNSCGMTGIEGSGWCEREICRGSLACIWLQGHGTDMPVKRQIWESGGVRDLRETVSFTTSNALSGSESGVTIRVWFSKEIYEYHTLVDYSHQILYLLSVTQDWKY